ncbi:MAG: hypothetical protein KC729_21080 [Candidatus Eisenbacteria bacterium]|uniref:Lamin tail domain-containing protein n=1 Tax=Eiseniibacteriota bacterium TaxID=2212470 RepID=A0A956M5E8_UNCEI|nr:hypothetical protein [Candidatus Eisenbacteria bacterium]
MNHASRAILLTGLAFALGALSRSAEGAVYLNEVVVRGTERVEIYNSGPDPVLLDGWTIQETGSFPIPDGILLGVGEYRVFNDLGGIMNDIGGDLDLIDDLKGRADAVQYGDQGGAPLPHDVATVSLCRAPDAAALPPLDPTEDADYWTLDLSSTFGFENDVPPPTLGVSLVINELDPNGGGGFLAGDNVEVYNPTGSTVITGGWFMAFGNGSTAPVTFSLVIPLEVASMKLPADIDLAETKLAYLFNDLGERVDQLGWNGPLASRGDLTCIGRCPNGAGPNDGYDAGTSGGGETLFELECSIGVVNPDECGPTPTRSASWGEVKALHRR